MHDPDFLSPVPDDHPLLNRTRRVARKQRILVATNPRLKGVAYWARNFDLAIPSSGMIAHHTDLPTESTPDDRTI